MPLTQVKTTGIADDAVTTDKMASGTDGRIISYDASGNPTTIGPGTDGQVLTSTGAGSPPAFEDAAAAITINTNADNRVITGSSSANTLIGESTLTFDGTTLTTSTDVSITGASGNTRLNFNRTNAAGSNGNQFGLLKFHDNNDYQVAGIEAVRASAVDDADIVFKTRPTGGSVAERVRIDTTGDLQIADGDLVIGTSGHGIDFSATSDTAGKTSELLDDYEVGTWTPTLTNGPSLSSETGRYIKIGKVVHVFWAITTASSGGSASHVGINNLPFANTSTQPFCGGTAWDYRTNEVSAHVSGSNLWFYTSGGAAISGNEGVFLNETFRACTTYEVA